MPLERVAGAQILVGRNRTSTFRFSKNVKKAHVQSNPSLCYLHSQYHESRSSSLTPATLLIPRVSIFVSHTRHIVNTTSLDLRLSHPSHCQYHGSPFLSLTPATLLIPRVSIFVSHTRHIVNTTSLDLRLSRPSHC